MCRLKQAFNILLVVGDCIFVGLQPILVYISKNNGNFDYSPISVNFFTETEKVFFAIFMLFIQERVIKRHRSSAHKKKREESFCNDIEERRLLRSYLQMMVKMNIVDRRKKVGEKSLPSFSTFVQAARNNMLLAVPAFLYAINNYLKFTMQLYFNPATVKMLSNLKVTVPSFASVYNEYALKSQFETSIYLQNLFLYGYGAIFNFLAILVTALFKGPSSLDMLHGHSKATMLLICNNAAQGILSSFFFKYADTILKKYSSTVATIFTGIASAVLFGHTLTMNFILGISIVFISMHQFFSPLSKVKDEPQNGRLEMVDSQNNQRSKDSSFINMAAGANDDASHRVEHDEKAPLLPI